jgi:outer membrane protein assembly factor BamB
MKASTALVILMGLVLLTQSTHAANWPQWRGPHFNGSTEESNLPLQWSKTDNLAWKRDLPGSSAATPIVWNDKVLISTTDDADETLLAMCLDRKTGHTIWSSKVATGLKRDSRSNYASPSPVTNGKQAIFFYGNGELVVFDMDGNKLWGTNIQKRWGDFFFQWTFSSTPLLYGNTLYLQVLQRDVPVHGKGFSDRPNESYIAAFDPANGDLKWKITRPSKAQAESLESFTTPMPYTHDGRTEILILGGDDITGHDPATGRELWRWGTWNPSRIGHWRLVPSPVAGDGIALACAPKRDPIYAVKLGGNGTLTDDALAWVSRDDRSLSSDVPTPAFAHGDFFILSDVRGALSRVESKTGKIKWSTELPGRSKYEASPTVADGKVYIMNFAAEVVVLDAETGEIKFNIPMGERGDDMTRSAIAVSHGNLFIRTNSKLYCIGK